MNPHIQIIEPPLDELKPFIAYYYFHIEDSANVPPAQFTYYPHIKHALTIYKNSKLELIDKYTTRATPDDSGYSLHYTSLINHFARAQLFGPFNKVGVVFQPLGMNHFIDKNLNELVHQTFNLNLDRDLFSADFTPCLDDLFATRNISDQAAILDSYFKQVYKGFSGLEMKKAIQLISKKNEDYNVQELADDLDISRRTLLRFFKKHLNCSVRDYLRISKFRRAVDYYQLNSKESSLTQLAYDMNYYDQSEFIKHFKHLTGFSPKPFFMNLNPKLSQGIYWSTD